MLAVKELDETILERGHKALIRSLGPAGAIEFLRASADTDQPPGQDDRAKRLLIEFELDGEIIYLHFSSPTTWLAFDESEAIEFTSEILKRVSALQQARDPEEGT